jgi:NAD(P)-dependent dehydrogenase (short-subunit alcohol dehydrogenase family)
MDPSRTFTDRCLADKVCMVMGGGTIAPGWGIGKAIAVAYARAGAKVVVADINAEAAAETAGIISAEGNSAIACQVDVTDPHSVDAVVRLASSSFGGVDVLHNNVGLGKAGDSALTTVDDWRRISDANLLSLHIAAQAVIPGMKKRGGGVILCTSSIASMRHVGVPHLAYGATKAAANHFAKLLAVEYARFGIRVNVIVVGMVDTPRIRKTMMGAYGGNEEEMLKRRNAQIPLGFMGDAWDVANAALFLASDRARFITGTELVLDGGLSATARG